ncbi:hypothetical protein ABTY56_37680, partial [Kitasatospora sp. NPDC097691]
ATLGEHALALGASVHMPRIGCGLVGPATQGGRRAPYRAKEDHTMMTSLHRLVADPETFRNAWPDTPTVYDKDADDLRLLASRQAAREILADPDLRPGGFGMVRDGVLTAESPSADHPTDTLVLNGLHRSWPPLVTFCKALSTQLGHPVTGNVYLTPAGGAKGFG